MSSVMFVISEELRNNRASASRVLHLADELRKQGIESKIVGKQPSEDKVISHDAVFIKPIFKGFIGNLLLSVQISLFVLKNIFSRKIDFVITRGYVFWLLMLAVKLTGKTNVYDFHGYAHKEQMVEGRRYRAIFTRIFDQLSLELADRVLVIREELRDDLPPRIQKKTLILPNGVDLEEFDIEGNPSILDKYKIPQNKDLVCFIGNWEAWIAIDDLLESEKYLGQNQQIVIIGTGRYLEEYKKKYPDVLFTGRVPHADAVILLKKMNACVCPYSTEIIAKNKSYRKIYEYLAAGKPIITNDAPGRETFLKAGENELVYKSGDPSDLADKIKMVLSDKELQSKMGKNNLLLAEDYSWEKVTLRSGLAGLFRSDGKER